MQSLYSGVAKQTNDENKLSMYVHCFLHILNLCVVGVCGKVVPIHNIFDTLNKIYAFFGASSKLNLLFEKTQQKLNVLNSSTLKSLNETRSSCHIKSICSIINYISITSTLEEINDINSCRGSYLLLKIYKLMALFFV